MHLLGFALAAVVGLSLGLLGGGGSILTVPILVYILGFAPKPAVAMSLPVVGITSLVGAIGHWRAGRVELKPALLFGALAMTGAFAGARLAVFLSGAVQLTLLGAVMLVAAVSMLRGTSQPDTATGPASTKAWIILAGAGIGVGILTGIVGIGGGFLIVPALVLLARVPMKRAVGTSLLVIAMNSLAGFAGYLGKIAIDWPFVASFSIVAALGVLAGAALTRFVSQQQLRRAFAAFLVVVGIFTLYRNRGVFADATGRAPVSAPAAATHQE